MSEKKERINYSAYYILPMLRLNMTSYGKDNFINSYVTKFGQVVVKIKDKELAGEYYNHENCTHDVDCEGGTLIIYDLPDIWLPDYQHFLDGKYSRFSSIAKDQVIAHAKPNKLDINVNTGNFMSVERYIEGELVTKRLPIYLTSKFILSLNKDKDRRAFLERELGVKIHKDAELLDALHDCEFIKL